MITPTYTFEVHLVRTERKIYYVQAESGQQAAEITRGRLLNPDRIIVMPGCTPAKDLPLEVYTCMKIKGIMTIIPISENNG